jgi:uncharacterized lipoprotein
VMVAVTDIRGGRPDQIGVKKNGYGMEMAPILASRPVSEVVRGAVTEELRKSGFDVGPSEIVVAVDLVRLTNDFKMGFFSGDAVAEITLAVQVKSPYRGQHAGRRDDGEWREREGIFRESNGQRGRQADG